MQYDKPGIESDCVCKNKRSRLSAELDDMLARNSQKLIIFAEHHPFKSYGIHGGYFTLKQHIFPLTEAKPKSLLSFTGYRFHLSNYKKCFWNCAGFATSPHYQNMIERFARRFKKTFKCYLSCRPRA